MLREEVFEARIVLGRQILSSRVNISIFDSISSGTASMTRSASRAASSTDPAYSSRENAASAAPAETLPSSTALSRLVRISPSALRRALGRRSSRMVRYPPTAAALGGYRNILEGLLPNAVRKRSEEHTSELQS